MIASAWLGREVERIQSLPLFMPITEASRLVEAPSGTSKIRVRYVECDPMGVAHHASYLPWFEEARTELLRSAGQTYEQMERDGVFLVVAEVGVKYRRPIRYDDVLIVRTTLSGASAARLFHQYEIRLAERAGKPVPEAEVCTIATTTLVCVGGQGRPRILPESLLAR
jgi:acyl-CoA thioester hydrolase